MPIAGRCDRAIRNWSGAITPIATAATGDTKRWKDVWSAGQGVTLIDEVLPIERIVDDIVREYHDAKARLG